MIYRFFILIGFMFAFLMPNFATAVVANAFDMEDHAIVDSEEVDITTDGVVLNMDADAANVSSFDIAGIMLGMSFDDVQTLLNSLYDDDNTVLHLNNIKFEALKIMLSNISTPVLITYTYVFDKEKLLFSLARKGRNSFCL